MKRFIALFLCLGLLGCAQFSAVQEAFAPRPNPITQETLTKAENSFILALVALGTYKQLCAEKQIDRSCRARVEYLQKTYTRPAKPILKNLRKFVDDNDQVNALTALNTLTQITNDLKRETPITGAH